MSLEVKCPRCEKIMVYSKDNPYRPFCSERCKLIDLGNWADGKYAIEGKKIDPSQIDLESLAENPGKDSDSDSDAD